MIFRKILFSILFLFLLLPASRLSAQDYECVSTDPLTGAVTITWSWPSVYSVIDHWVLQWSATSGVWNGTDSTGFANTGLVMSYTIPLINGNTNRYYFRLLAELTSTNAQEITLSTIFLSVTALEKGVARLDWNPARFSHTGTFFIQRFEYSQWRTIDSVPYNSHSLITSYNDTVSAPFCTDAVVRYRTLFQLDMANCLSVSNADSGEFYDRYSPSNPYNDTVSIYTDPTGSYTGCPVIGWSKSPQRDVAGYIIYREDPVFIALDTIPADSTIFLDKSIRACLQPYTYALAAIDSCGKTSYGTYTIAPHSLVLTFLDIDPCERKAYLSWNAYDNMPGGLGGYIIYRQINNGSFSAIATVSNTSTNYADSLQFINGSSYAYYIRAFSKTGLGSSSSCMKRRPYNGPVTPDTLYIEQASVVNDRYVEVKYYYSPVSRIRKLVLERSDSPLGPFIPVDTLASAGTNFLPQQYILTDPTANVKQKSYFYRLTMIDSCNKAALFSENTACTIHLTCNNSAANSNQLTWNIYSIWNKGVDRYEVFRTLNGTPDPTGPLAVITSPPYQYDDNLNTLSPIAQACYYVKAFEVPGNAVVPDAFSVSNIACSMREPMLNLPTAFSPGGLNNRFRPVHAFVETGSFSMQIYNKWGQLIFETVDINNGWNGYVNGRQAPADVYIYRVSYKSFQGDAFVKRGAVTLVR